MSIEILKKLEEIKAAIEESNTTFEKFVGIEGKMVPMRMAGKGSLFAIDYDEDGKAEKVEPTHAVQVSPPRDPNLTQYIVRDLVNGGKITIKIEPPRA